MSNDAGLNEIMATSLMQYNQSKFIAIQHKETDIEKFCDQRIIYFCSGLNKGGHLESIFETLEEMKQSQPKYIDAIEKSIIDLKAEQHASELTEHGKTQADAQTDEEWENADIQLKESCDFISNEMVPHVQHNLTVKSEMEEFKPEHHAISNALLSLNINRFEDLTASATVEEQVQ